MLNESQIQANWDTFRNLINSTFTGERKDALNKMYDFFEERAAIAPASGREHFHNSFPGGYIDHVLRVIDLTLQQYELWHKNGFDLSDFTKEELIFSAMHHDLGKLGDLSGDYYLPNDSQWHREKMGLIYKFNENIHHMKTAARTFFLLQHFGIKYNQIEMLGIHCTDGLYDEDNETYLKQSDSGRGIKTDIVYLLHHADLMASRLEHTTWKAQRKLNGSVKSSEPTVVMHKNQNLSKLADIAEKHSTDKQKQLFDDLFK